MYIKRTFQIRSRSSSDPHDSFNTGTPGRKKKKKKIVVVARCTRCQYANSAIRHFDNDDDRFPRRDKLRVITIIVTYYLVAVHDHNRFPLSTNNYIYIFLFSAHRNQYPRTGAKRVHVGESIKNFLEKSKK